MNIEELRFDSFGFPCLISRKFVICGYVAIPLDHPYHGLSEDDLDKAEVVAANSGITYSGRADRLFPENPDGGALDLIWELQ